MVKTSKSIPQKEIPSSSKPSENVSPAATEEPTPEPPLKSFVTSRSRTPLGLWKDVKMRPPSADDDIYTDPPAPKQDKEKKRKKAPISPAPKKKTPRKQLACKPKNVSARGLSPDSLQRLGDESKEEEDSELVARVRSGSEMPQSMEAVEEDVAKVSEPGRIETDFPRASKVEKETVIGTSRSEYNVPKEAFGVIDLSRSPLFTNSMINEAQALKGNLGEGAQAAADSFHNFFDGLNSTTSEDVTGLGDLPDQARMNEVEAPYLFNEAQQVLNQASVLHHEDFLRYREEFKRHEAVTRELIEKKDAYKLLSEKLQAELEAARKEHSGLVE
ncbi:uncharacterized protein [Nicotiana tomentosiformis]|uniref:uncharacterized protein n=1 Tax=Nicotiana tomentosiformis TaxID=4098 RepID=UPI00388C377A